MFSIHRPLRNEYKDIIESNYGVTLKAVDYENSPDESVDEINKISNQLSGGQMTNAINKNDFLGASLILSAGASFKGEWKQQFDPYKTSKEKFYDGNGQHVGYVDMMFQNSHLNYTEITQLGCHALEMPYVIPECMLKTLKLIQFKNKNDFLHFIAKFEGFQHKAMLSLIVLLPKINQTLKETAEKLYNLGLVNLYMCLRRAGISHPKRKVDTFFPNFAIDTDFDLGIISKMVRKI